MGGGNSLIINVLMDEDTKNIDEVMVVGYGTSKKRSLISSVSVVKAKELENLPVSNMTQGLAGRSPGLVIKSSPGLNAKNKITIRGGGTPLVVIDGVIRNYDDFVNLSPEDIESFVILKDASATAVYGSRAANGILQVTTKKGKKGKLTVNYNFSKSFSQPSVWRDKLNSYERALQANIAAKNDGLTEPYSQDDLNKYADGSDPFGHPNTDWQDIVLNDFSTQTKHNINWSGGSKNNHYFISLGNLYKESLYKKNTHNLNRTNFRLNQESINENIGLRINTSIDGSIEKTEHPYSSSASSYYQIFSHIQNKSPFDLAKNKNGMPYNIPDNPLSEISDKAGYIKDNNNFINGRLLLEWQLPWLKELKLKTIGNYRYFSNTQKKWRKDPAKYDWDSNEPMYGSKPELHQSASSGYQYTLQYFADFQKQIADHYISALVGYEASYGFFRTQGLSRDGYNFPIDQVNPGPEASMKNNGFEAENGRAGYIGQLKYNYKNRYFAEGSIRYDGSDKFPEDKRWGTFYSASLGWQISDESFMEYFTEKNIFNTLKFRVSYGEVGMDEGIERFAYLPSYNLNSQAYVINGKIQPGFSEGSIPSPDISWYTSKQFDIGFDFTSLEGRLFGSFGYFFYKTTGYLHTPDSLKSGYTDPLGVGLPKIKTDGEKRRAGFETELGWKQSVTNDFSYEVSFNITKFDELWARNPYESLEAKKNPYKRTTQEIGYWGTAYKNLGFYKNENDVLNSAKRINSKNLTAGDLKYEDFNGDGAIDGADFTRVGKNSFPRANYGINLNAKYKGFFTNILFQGATSFNIEMGSTVKMNDAQTGSLPVYEFQTKYWTPNNTNARYPRLLSGVGINGNNNAVTSDFWLINGAYFRLKDIQIGYDFKKLLGENLPWLKKFNIALSGQNLFTISEALKYGMDPETASTNNYAYPNERVYSINVNLGF